MRPQQFGHAAEAVSFRVGDAFHHQRGRDIHAVQVLPTLWRTLVATSSMPASGRRRATGCWTVTFSSARIRSSAPPQ